VIPPPPIPPQLPQRAPASERICRLRFGFAKTGSLALISHLDTLRLLERALRRSRLPVSFTGGFHPLPRLQLALPLPLGVEGRGEWLDLEFVQPLDPELALERLGAQLPDTFQLLSAQQVPLTGPSLSQELHSARWTLALAPETGESIAADRWQAAVAALLAAPELLWHDTDKKGRPRQRDCRPALMALELAAVTTASAELALQATIDGAGRSLRPEQLRDWLAERLQQPLVLGKQCRQELSLSTVLTCLLGE
jgi:radical SAM-linked protein